MRVRPGAHPLHVSRQADHRKDFMQNLQMSVGIVALESCAIPERVIGYALIPMALTRVAEKGGNALVFPLRLYVTKLV